MLASLPLATLVKLSEEEADTLAAALGAPAATPTPAPATKKP